MFSCLWRQLFNIFFQTKDELYIINSAGWCWGGTGPLGWPGWWWWLLCKGWWWPGDWWQAQVRLPVLHWALVAVNPLWKNTKTNKLGLALSVWPKHIDSSLQEIMLFKLWIEVKKYYISYQKETTKNSLHAYNVTICKCTPVLHKKITFT